MATAHPRIQVTLDPELQAALADAEGRGPRSQQLRDLALRGAEALRAERDRRAEAVRFLDQELSDDRYDFSEAQRLHERRR